MSVTCCSCGAVFSNPREVAMPREELAGYASLCGWLVGSEESECGECVAKWLKDVEERFVSKEAVANAQ